MTAITADDFLRTPLLERVAEALSAIGAQHGRARAVAWARSSDDITRIVAVAVVLERTALALNLLRDLDEAHRSGSEKRKAKVSKRPDRVLASLATNHEA